MADNSSEDKASGKKDPAPPADSKPIEYSFFVNEPGNSQYNYSLDSLPVSMPDTSLPDWFNTMATPAPLPTTPLTNFGSISSPLPASVSPASASSPELTTPPATLEKAPNVAKSSAPQQPSFEPIFDYAPVYTAAAAEMALEHSRDDADFESPTYVKPLDPVSENHWTPSAEQKTSTTTQYTGAMAQASFAQEEKIAQGAQVAQTASFAERATVAQNSVYGSEANVVQNSVYGSEASVVQNVIPQQNVSAVENAYVSQDAGNALRNYGIEQPQPSSAEDADKPWPTPRKEKNRQGNAAPLHLSTDKRFVNLVLNPELAATVDRIYSLVDLDFNGYVDFPEMSSVLTSEHLTESEKGFVQMIYTVGCKILSERPAVASGTVPVLTKDDFRLAFAYQCATSLGSVATSKGILATSSKGAAPAPTTAFKATLYADTDYPLVSLKAAAVRLGTMGDAYFAAGAASLVEGRPRSLLRILSENSDHSYTVVFPGSHAKPLEVMPPRPEEIVRYGVAAKYGFWFPLLEKAYGIFLAQNHRLSTKLSDRNEALNRASQVIETLTGSFTGTLVTADCSAADLQGQLSILLEKKRIVIAVSSDFVPETSTFAGLAPVANKPYPVTGVDLQRGLIFVNSVYNHETIIDDQPDSFTTAQFLQYFKIIYFEQEFDSENKSSSMLRSNTTPKGLFNPWKNA